MSDELMKRTGATPKKPTGFVDPTDSIINSSEGGGKFLIRFCILSAFLFTSF